MSLMADVRYAIAAVTDRAMDLAMPVTCAGCYAVGTPLCADCRAALDHRFRSGLAASIGTIAEVPSPLSQLAWCGPLSGLTRRALHRLGEAGERRLSAPLGEAIAERWSVVGGSGDVLVPVPASAESILARGYDEAVLLARVAGRRLGLPVVEALARTAAPASARDSAFEVVAGGRISGLTVVLIDDVMTTGATLVACATALLDAGAQAVSAVTVARDHSPAQVPAQVLAATA